MSKIKNFISFLKDLCVVIVVLSALIGMGVVTKCRIHEDKKYSEEDDIIKDKHNKQDSIKRNIEDIKFDKDKRIYEVETLSVDSNIKLFYELIRK